MAASRNLVVTAAPSYHLKNPPTPGHNLHPAGEFELLTFAREAEEVIRTFARGLATESDRLASAASGLTKRVLK
jgi:hypothetical protein